MSSLPPPRRWILLLTLAALTGCGDQQRRYDAERDTAAGMRLADHLHASAAHTMPADATPPPTTDPFAGVERLDWERFFQRLHTHSPRLAHHIALWQASLARYPQATALSDPTVSYGLAPRSLGNDRVGQTVTLTQPVPWPGKLTAQGEAALADTEAERAAVADEHRHHLIESRAMFAEYWLAERQLELLGQTRQVLITAHQAARAAQAAGGEVQTTLEATLALADVDRELLAARRLRSERVADLNAMLGRTADAALPPTVTTLPDPPPLRPLPELKAWSHGLPAVRVAEARLHEAEARVTRAERGRFPDLALSAGYSTLEDYENRFTLGVAIELPVQNARRAAAVDEQNALVRSRRAELAQTIADAESAVVSSHARISESAGAIALLRDGALPIARQALDTARAGYAAGTSRLADVLRAERTLLTLRLKEADELHEWFHLIGYVIDTPQYTGDKP